MLLDVTHGDRINPTILVKHRAAPLNFDKNCDDEKHSLENDLIPVPKIMIWRLKRERPSSNVHSFEVS